MVWTVPCRGQQHSGAVLSFCPKRPGQRLSAARNSRLWLGWTESTGTEQAKKQLESPFQCGTGTCLTLISKASEKKLRFFGVEPYKQVQEPVPVPINTKRVPIDPNFFGSKTLHLGHLPVLKG